METFIEQLENKGRLEGLVEGRVEGRVEGKLNMLKSMVKLKFPTASAVELDNYSGEQLEIIAQRLLTYDTWEEVIGIKR